MSDRDDTTLDDLDRELLNALQWDFPLDAAARTRRWPSGSASPRTTVLARIARVKDAGVLRQLSAIFDTRALGYASSLVAAKVDPDRIDDAAAVISEHPGVSHNYKRNHDVQPLVHARGAARRVPRRAPRRAAPRRRARSSRASCRRCSSTRSA